MFNNPELILWDTSRKLSTSRGIENTIYSFRNLCVLFWLAKKRKGCFDSSNSHCENYYKLIEYISGDFSDRHVC
jgi:hypothetical protein